MKFLAVLVFCGCTQTPPRIVLKQHPLVRLEVPVMARRGPIDWCPGEGCDYDDGSFRAASTDGGAR